MSIVHIALCRLEDTHKANVTLADQLVMSANVIITRLLILNDPGSCVKQTAALYVYNRFTYF